MQNEKGTNAVYDTFFIDNKNLFEFLFELALYVKYNDINLKRKHEVNKKRENNVI